MNATFTLLREHTFPANLGRVAIYHHTAGVVAAGAGSRMTGEGWTVRGRFNNNTASPDFLTLADAEAKFARLVECWGPMADALAERYATLEG